MNFNNQNSFIFGSGDCDIPLKDPQNFVSNRHFEIYKENQEKDNQQVINKCLNIILTISEVNFIIFILLFLRI